LSQVASSARKQAGITVYLIAVLPPLFWAGNFLLARMFRNEIPPLQMSFWRWAIAMVILLAFFGPGLRAHLHVMRAEWARLCLLALLGITAFNAFVYSALHYTTVINGSLVNTMLPVITFILALIILGDRISLRQGVGVLLAFLGALVVITQGSWQQLASLSLNKGDLLVLCGTTCWALYTVLLRWRPSKLPPMVFLTVVVILGVLFHIPFVAWEIAEVGTFSPTWGRLGALLYFAVFASILAYICWNKAVATIGPGKTGTFMYLLPFFSAVLAIVFLGERLELFHVVGIALILAGVVLVTRPARQPAPQGR